jgi:cell division protein FtsB
MNKTTLTIISILSVLVITLFFLLKDANKDNKQLTTQLDQATTEITKLKEYNVQKEVEMNNIQQAYNKVVSNYKGTECENMKVSVEMIEALKTIRDANESK